MTFLGFLEILYNRLEELYPPERMEEVVQTFRKWYRSSRIEEEHVYEMGISFPEPDDEDWQIVFGIVGGDTVVFLDYTGWEFKRITTN